MRQSKVELHAALNDVEWHGRAVESGEQGSKRLLVLTLGSSLVVSCLHSETKKQIQLS